MMGVRLMKQALTLKPLMEKDMRTSQNAFEDAKRQVGKVFFRRRLRQARLLYIAECRQQPGSRGMSTAKTKAAAQPSSRREDALTGVPLRGMGQRLVVLTEVERLIE